MFRLKLNEESGMAMVVAVVVTLIGSVLAGSYMTVVISEYRNSVWQKQRAQSLFLAEAGIEKGLYYLNNTSDPGNPWTDQNGNLLSDAPMVTESLADGQYTISLFDKNDEPWLPANSYLVRSVGIIPRTNSEDIEHRVSCVAGKLSEIPIPAALGIMDGADPEVELLKFDSSQWTINGRDLDGPGGKPGITVSNNGDDIPGQLKPARIDQVTGYNTETGEYTSGVNAIVVDTTLPQSLDAYINYFKRMAIDISGLGTIPASLLGTSSDYEILYADLSKGPIKLAGTDRGSGVLLLEGDGQFEMVGGSEWNGIVICAGNSRVILKGGGATPSHINGALLIANGYVEMNGTTDVRYSSSRVLQINSQLVLYQVYSWSEGWGNAL